MAIFSPAMDLDWMWNGKKFASPGSYEKKHRAKAHHENGSSNWRYIEFKPNLRPTSGQQMFYRMVAGVSLLIVL